jgi:hypothetical protein
MSVCRAFLAYDDGRSTTVRPCPVYSVQRLVLASSAPGPKIVPAVGFVIVESCVAPDLAAEAAGTCMALVHTLRVLLRLNQSA